jgi:hypothetical protein
MISRRRNRGDVEALFAEKWLPMGRAVVLARECANPTSLTDDEFWAWFAKLPTAKRLELIDRIAVEPCCRRRPNRRWTLIAIVSQSAQPASNFTRSK